MPAARRARSAWASTGSACFTACLRALEVASSTCLRARRAAVVPRLRAVPVRPSISSRLRPSSCSRSDSTSLVCLRPRSTISVTRRWASSVVTRPRFTASAIASSIRSRRASPGRAGRSGAWRSPRAARPRSWPRSRCSARLASSAAPFFAAVERLRAAFLRVAAPFLAAAERFAEVVFFFCPLLRCCAILYRSLSLVPGTCGLSHAERGQALAGPMTRDLEQLEAVRAQAQVTLGEREREYSAGSLARRKLRATARTRPFTPRARLRVCPGRPPVRRPAAKVGTEGARGFTRSSPRGTTKVARTPVEARAASRRSAREGRGGGRCGRPPTSRPTEHPRAGHPKGAPAALYLGGRHREHAAEVPRHHAHASAAADS